MVSRLRPRGGLVAGEHVLNQRRKDGVVHRCELQQAGVQPLELALGLGVEVDTPDALLGMRALQPTKEDLSGARVCDRLLAQTTLDLRV